MPYTNVRGSKANGYSGNSRHHPYESKNNSPNRRRNNNKTTSEGCFKCGEPGHFKRDCPNDSASKKSNDDFYNFGDNTEQIDWSNKELVEINRCFYKESIETSNVSDETIEEWKKTHSIKCSVGFDESENKDFGKLPKPAMSFNDISFGESISNAIKKAGFDKPTPIQSVTLPMLLSGNNVIGIAQTGSGKTVSFLLPGIIHIINNKKAKQKGGYSSPIGLIIAPTRELACQIESEFIQFGANSNISHCCVYGGQSKYIQRCKLFNGVELIIATPGRLTDFFNNGMITFENISYVVIDEADRLLDMGFEPSLNYILSNIRPDRQLCMFSATWPKQVQKLAKKYLCNSNDADVCVMQVSIGQVTNGLKANENVKQIIKMIDRQSKINQLKECINQELEKDNTSKIIVFISTKRMTKLLENILWENGYYVTCIHGDKEQKQRDDALNDFKNGNMQIMLATDVASRGIHVNDIKLVINFDFPMKIEDYIHRIGRTGRGNSKGTAISFFNKEIDCSIAKDLIKIMKDANQQISNELMQLQYSKSRNRSRWW